VAQIRKSAEVVQNVVTYPVIIAASNPELALFPGMTAIVRIVVANTAGVLKIPNQALQFAPNDRTPENGTVWVLGSNGKPVPIPVTPGASDGAFTAVLSGDLQAGQQVIIGTASSMDSVRSFGIRIGS
jgi:HlyD family secretion protein